MGVSKVEQIKAAIEQLSPRERADLNALLQNWPEDQWGREMTRDAQPDGKLHKLKQRAEAEARAGQLREFPKRYHK